MVANQLVTPGRDISDPAVLRAMGEVPREYFVPSDLQSAAYEDRPLPIGYGQTISQPYIVAKMTELLGLEPQHRVLEIGTGCGYQTAVLARVAAQVYSIEVVPPLARMAARTLAALPLEVDNVTLRQGDGYAGWPEEAPFDGIIVTCAPPQVPPLLVEQLAENGRLVVPVGVEGGPQKLLRLRRRGGEVDEEIVIPVVFVPMTGVAQTAGNSA